MSLYDDLGVRKDAKPDEIKRAYRKRAKETHPDKPGGDKETFQKVAKAYALLSDDTRRAEYDKTGEEGSDATNKLAVIAGMLFAAIDHVQSVDHENLVEHVRSNIAHGMANGEKFIGELRAKISKRERTKRRITKKSGNNLLAEMIQGNIDGLQRQIASTENQIEEGREMLKLLEEYEYLCEINMPAAQLDNFTVRFLSTGSPDGYR